MGLGQMRRLFIGLACVAVFAAGGFYLYEQWIEQRRDEAAADFLRERGRCLVVIDRIKAGTGSADDRTVLLNCLSQGLVVESETDTGQGPLAP